MKTIEDFAQWLKKQRRKGSDEPLQAGTVDAYLFHAEKLFKKDIEKWSDSQLLDHSKTIRDSVCFASYRHLLSFLGREDLASRLKKRFGLSKDRRKEKVRRKVIDRGDILALVNHAQNTQEELIFSLMYDTALRRAELLNIGLKNINFEERKITVVTKGNKTRKVWYHEDTEQLLLKHIKEQKLKDDDKLFTILTTKGQPYRDQGDGLYKVFKRAGWKVLGENRDIHPHMFRHSRLTHMSDEGAGISDIQEFAGHADVQTTQIYVEIGEKRAKDAWDKYAKPLRKI